MISYEKIQQVTLALVTLCIFASSCGPNDDKGAMDDKSSGGEGAVDTTKIPNFDSTHASDSTHSSLSSPNFTIPSGNTGNAKL